MAGKKGRSGRKPKSQNRQNTEMILAETAPHAAGYLRTVVKGLLGTYIKITYKKNGDRIEEVDMPVPADPVRVDTCKYVVNQDLGMPKQRQEISGTQKIDLNINPQELTDEQLAVIAATNIIHNARNGSAGIVKTEASPS